MCVCVSLSNEKALYNYVLIHYIVLKIDYSMFGFIL